MSVLIRGMQIQDNCKECRMRTDYDFCSAMPKEFCGYTNDIRCPDWCPLVEIPEKHGRLIDADELIDYCNNMIRIISESDDDMINIITSRICYASVIRQIINMATIFEAEGEE